MDGGKSPHGTFFGNGCLRRDSNSNISDSANYADNSNYSSYTNHSHTGETAGAAGINCAGETEVWRDY